MDYCDSGLGNYHPYTGTEDPLGLLVPHPQAIKLS